jgi:2-methylcitrate dehydratase PrpD
VTATETLAAFAADLRWTDVPLQVRAQLKLHVLDTLGVICAGVPAPEAGRVRGLFERWGGCEEATVIGANRRLPAPSAAFLNTFAGRLHTFDDTYEDGPVHPGSTAVSAALAAAETRDASGADFLVAALAGYETTARISSALGASHYGSGFHNTGTCNVFGACAAAARASGLDAAAIADALGIAGQAAAGLRQYQIDGSLSDTALNAARAAHAGVTAVALQVVGLRGPHGVLDGRWGLARVMSTDARLETLREGLGSAYAFTSTSLKPYPSCRFTHGPFDELLALRERHQLKPESIETIEIATFRESIEVSDKPRIASRSDAVLSHQYAAARALIDGTLTLDDFQAPRREEASVRALAERVRVVYDASLQAAYPAAWPHRITVACRDGRQFVAESLRPPGGADAPLARDRVVRKFLQLTAPVLGDERSSTIVPLVERLEELARISELACALR